MRVLGTRVRCAKTVEQIEMPFVFLRGGADSSGSKELCLMEVQIPYDGVLLRGDAGHCKV